MTGTSEGNDYVYGYPQYPPQNSAQDPPQYIPYPHYDLLPGSPRRSRSRLSCCRRSCCHRSCCHASCSALKVSLTAVLLLVLLGGLGFLAFPRKPDLKVKRITLEDISIDFEDQDESILPSAQLDVSLSLLLMITNPNFFGVAYDNVSVSFSYRGDNLGKVVSEGGNIPSRSVVMATATLDLEGKELLEHAVELIKDVASGTVPLETVTVFQGAVKMFLFSPQVEVKVYCSLLVDPKEKEVLNSDCSLSPPV